jgi:hypothetical protein
MTVQVPMPLMSDSLPDAGALADAFGSGVGSGVADGPILPTPLSDLLNVGRTSDARPRRGGRLGLDPPSAGSSLSGDGAPGTP